MSFTRQYTLSLGTEQISWSSEAWLSHSDEQSKPTVQRFNKSEQNCGGVATFLSRHWQGPQGNDLRYDQQPDEINCIVNGNFLIVCSSLRFMITLNDNFDIKFFRSPESLRWPIAMGWHPSSCVVHRALTSSPQKLLGQS